MILLMIPVGFILLALGLYVGAYVTYVISGIVYKYSDDTEDIDISYSPVVFIKEMKEDDFGESWLFVWPLVLPLALGILFGLIVSVPIRNGGQK